MKKFTFKIFASLTIILWSLMPTMAQTDYSTDVIVNNAPTLNQRKVSLAVADNGWLYAAFITNEDATFGYGVYKSTDNGLNWSEFVSYSSPSEVWYGVKVIVCGPAPYKVYIAKLISLNSTGFYRLYVSTHNGTTNAFINNPYSYTTASTSPILDFDIVADDALPSCGSSPYGVGLLYSRRSAPLDSIKFVYSTNGGTNFEAPKTVETTMQYCGKVSLAYGYSYTYNCGRYNAVWEAKEHSYSRTGRIQYSRTSYSIDGDFITPVNLDVEPTVTGLCYNPKIACQFNTLNNDSGNVTAVVVFERAGNWSNNDNDIIGYWNNRASSENTWTRYNIDNSSSTNSKQPDINFDSYYNNFLVTYWDSTNTYLPFKVHSFNMTNSAWVIVTPNYNNNTTMGSLLQPYPIIEINNALHQVAHLWSREGTGSNGVVVFDAEYSEIGIKELITYNNNKINNIYPNPAYGAANIEVELNKSALVEINAYDMTGKKLTNLYKAQIPEGKSTISFNVSNLANGNYVVEMITPDSRTTTKMMVAH